ncbi:MAG: CoA-disulfide reductase [Chitinivibrionales bacterium]|nr:CoA-disulfide reductase [Chitinivibrionales bacterium]
MKTVIVGGVAGGGSAAARLRRLDEKAEIVMFERGEYISFANCGLPYYIGGVIKERDDLLVVKPQLMKDRFNVDVRTSSEVTAINRDRKTVTVHDKVNNNEYEESYDKLVLSPGAAPIRPPLPGINSSRIFTLRNIPDTDAIADAVDKGKATKAVVVGGGFIGLEMVENLHHRGLQVTLIEMAPQVMAPLDFEMAAMLHQHLQLKGIEFYLNDGVQRFEDTDKGISTTLAGGRTIDASLVILAIGVRPETKLAREAGLEINKGIIVNSKMQTSDPDILAVGDAVEINDFASGNRTLIPLAWPANKQGRIAADTIAGLDTHYRGTQGTAIAQLFDLTVASTGLNEKQLKAFGISYSKSFTHSAHHAGYYPGAIPLSIKLLFAPQSGKIFGAQIVGVKGVDKRIDVLAMAIRSGMTVFDLEEIELAYAPPYSSAKDPVIMAGFVASNIIAGRTRAIHWHDIAAIQKENGYLLDVRTREEFNLGAIDGAVNIPIDELRNRLDEIPRDKPVNVYCQIGLRGYVACRMLSQSGFDAANLSGGYKTWRFTTLKQANEDIYDSDKVELSDNIIAVGDRRPGDTADHIVDACGLQCPGPIMQLYQKIEAANAQETIDVYATDQGFYNDVGAWCAKTGHKLESLALEEGVVKARIRKSIMDKDASQSPRLPRTFEGKTIVLFSGDFDKAMAAMIIANTSASMGKNVSIFFTFWGLNLLRKDSPVRVRKNLIENMFGKMMPRGPAKFTLSKMNMLGAGTAMMKGIMRKKKVNSLEDLMQSALQSGVRFIACQMTMELMGIKPQELIDGIEFGGAATYVGTTDDATMNLFI